MYMGTDWWRWAIFHTSSTLRRQSVLRNLVSESEPSVRPPVEVNEAVAKSDICASSHG